MEDLGLSCFGCCGNNYANKKKLMADIKKNTLEFENRKTMTGFMTRTKDLRPSGICASLIHKNDKFYCPGHISIHGKRDYRNLDSDCDKDFVCRTFGLFQEWDKDKQKRFIDFIKSKKVDSFTYSIKMDNNSLLNEFEKKEKQ